MVHPTTCVSTRTPSSEVCEQNALRAPHRLISQPHTNRFSTPLKAVIIPSSDTCDAVPAVTSRRAQPSSPPEGREEGRKDADSDENDDDVANEEW